MAAVQHLDSPCLVLAGAGSGKTRVITHRIVHLLDQKEAWPEQILAVTFTNKAASEMRGRIEQLITAPIRSMWVGTFHGIAHRMLRLHWKQAGLPQNFQILDADDQLRLVKRTLKALDMSDEQWPPRAVTGWINAQKEEARRPRDLADLGDYTQRQYLRAYTAYEASCQQSGLVDFAELLLRAYELTRDDEQIQAHYRRRFRHILVDEFQDTNTLQYAWLRTLAGDSIYAQDKEIAEMLDMPRATVNTRLFRARQQLRALMEDAERATNGGPR